MELITSNISEYYDELYPVSDDQKSLFRGLAKRYTMPVKLLRVGCGAGLFEHLLAREGLDVTGIESEQELLHSANLRRRNQLMSVRFFQMSYLDMSRFLGKHFYNVVYSLENRIALIHDKTLMRKFFFDAKQLLTDDGILVLNLYNYGVFNPAQSDLPTRESLRAKLYSRIYRLDDGTYATDQQVETGNGRLLKVMEKVPMYPLMPNELEQFAKEAGFSKIELYGDYKCSPFTGNEETFTAIIS